MGLGHFGVRLWLCPGRAMCVYGYWRWGEGSGESKLELLQLFILPTIRAVCEDPGQRSIREQSSQTAVFSALPLRAHELIFHFSTPGTPELLADNYVHTQLPFLSSNCMPVLDPPPNIYKLLHPSQLFVQCTHQSQAFGSLQSTSLKNWNRGERGPGRSDLALNSSRPAQLASCWRPHLH